MVDDLYERNNDLIFKLKKPFWSNESILICKNLFYVGTLGFFFKNIGVPILGYAQSNFLSLSFESYSFNFLQVNI